MSDTEDQTEAELAKTRRVVAETVAEQSKAAEQAIQPAEETVTEDLTGRTKAELLEIAAEKGVEASASMKKADLVEALNEGDS